MIIDESSMISDGDVDNIVKYAKKNQQKIIFVGDWAQLPAVGDNYKLDKQFNILTSPIAKCFPQDDDNNQFLAIHLKEIKRQSLDNPVLKACNLFRSNVYQTTLIPRIDSFNQGVGIRFYHDHDVFVKKICKKISLINDRSHIYKVLAYTNEAVKNYNIEIRNYLRYFEKIEINDVLTGYQCSYSNNFYIENGQDYIVEDVMETNQYSIKYKSKIFHNLVGHIVKISYRGFYKIIFIPEVLNVKNFKVLKKLQILAQRCCVKDLSILKQIKVRKNYNLLKSKMVFMEDIYLFRDKIFTYDTLIKSHPGLRIKLKNLKYKDNAWAIKKYLDVIEDRESSNIPTYSDERLHDILKISCKDIDYGYSITIHKSQGSTYHTVFIDEQDIEDNIQDTSMNYKHNKIQNNIFEKNRLKYVAYSRPTNMVLVYTNEKHRITEYKSLQKQLKLKKYRETQLKRTANINIQRQDFKTAVSKYPDSTKSDVTQSNTSKTNISKTDMTKIDMETSNFINSPTILKIRPNPKTKRDIEENKRLQELHKISNQW